MRQDVGEFKESPPASNVTEKSEEGMDVARESAAATAAGLESGVSGGAAARLLALAFTEKDAKPGGQSVGEIAPAREGLLGASAILDTMAEGEAGVFVGGWGARIALVSTPTTLTSHPTAHTRTESR